MNSLSETEVALMRQRAHRLIPAGAHTYSRADDQFPAIAPAFVQQAKGCRFWDERGREYLDYSMGLLSVSLGHAHEAVNAAVMRALAQGTCYSRPSLLEGALAEMLSAIIPCAEMVKFSKNGSDVTAAAVRLARHYTGRDLVIRCRQHPFHSAADWFIGATSRPGGVPEAVRRQVLSFDYNDIDSLKALLDAHREQVACLIMEPMAGGALPAPGFLQAVKNCCEADGTLLIFDEIITGFRIHPAGGQGLYGVTPHLATFGKGIANGFPLAVLCGRSDIMRHGNIGGDVFLLSGTYGGETIGLSAAIATVGFHLEHKVPDYLGAYGTRLIQAFQAAIDVEGLGSYIHITGHPARPELRFVENGMTSFRLKTLFMQEMLKEGIFMERIGISFSHRAAERRQTNDAFGRACAIIGNAIRSGDPNQMIDGPIVQPVFTS